jgi:hypothetical protein
MVGVGGAAVLESRRRKKQHEAKQKALDALFDPNNLDDLLGADDPLPKFHAFRPLERLSRPQCIKTLFRR